MIRVSRRGEVSRFELARPLLGRGRYWTICYLVDGLMIDSGCRHAAAALLDAVRDRPLARVVNTHSHEDHIGGNGLLERERRVETLAHPLALAVLADPRSRQPLHPYRRVMWGWPEPSRARPVDDREVIETDHHRFVVYHTPGHSPDHLCLLEPERGWLFTGDLYVGGRDRALRAGYDVWAIIRSLERVAALGATSLFPGAARVPESAAAALADKIAHLRRLGERVLELDRQGASVSAITRALCGPPMWIEAVTLGHFSRRNLVLSYLERNNDPSDARWPDAAEGRRGPTPR